MLSYVTELRNLAKRKKARSGTRPPSVCKSNKSRLEVETLEDRLVPTVVFTPVFGAETVTTASNNVGMQHPTVNLIFSGSYWSTANGQSDETTLISSTKSILSGPYLSGTKQYGSDGIANFGSTWTDGAAIPHTHTTANVQSFLQNSITNHAGTAPGLNDWTHAPIYIVVSDPTSSTKVAGGVQYDGWNDSGSYVQSILGFKFVENMHIIWLSTHSNSGGTVVKDLVTEYMSHELAEKFSNPIGGSGITVQAPSGWNSTRPLGQIGDFEPDQNYTYRLNGNLVQAYWSRADNAFIVPDGNSQNFTLDPLWNGGTFTGTYNLRVKGDQLGANYADNIRLDTSPNTSGVRATMNGQAAEFESGKIKQVNIDTGGGSDFVQIATVQQGMTVNVDSSGRSNDYVLIGYNGSLAAIQGTVNVANTSGQTTLAIDNSADVQARAVTVTDHSVAFANLATINYSANRWSDGSLHGVTALNVTTDKAANCVDIESVSALTNTNIFADTQDYVYGPAAAAAHVFRTHT